MSESKNLTNETDESVGWHQPLLIWFKSLLVVTTLVGSYQFVRDLVYYTGVGLIEKFFEQ